MMASTNSAVKVCIRIRPVSYNEEMEQGQSASSGGSILLTSPNTLAIGKNHAFTFDAIFDPDASQEIVYRSTVVALIDKFMQGYHATIFAYGQTGSGKTFTMGTGLDGSMEGLNLGIVPRAIEEIFSRLSQAYPYYSPLKESSVRGMATVEASSPYQLYASFLEIYNEEIKDLLSSHQSHEPRPRLVLREDATGEIYLAGCTEERIYSPTELFSVLRKGTLCRTTASTEMNLTSSRSHAIFTLTLRQQAPEPDNGVDKAGSTAQSLVSKFHFVDLAGSERLKRTHAVGHRAKEAISINSGLLALGNVISALSDQTKPRTHIPYRDSKLTRLLQNALGGNSTTVMMACVSPADSNLNETLNTLKYAGRARNITNRVSVNMDSGGSLFEIAQLKKQVMGLKQELLLLKNGGSHHDLATHGPGHGLSKGMKEKFEKTIHDLTLENSQLKARAKASQALIEHRSIDEVVLSPMVAELATLRSRATISDILFSPTTNTVDAQVTSTAALESAAPSIAALPTTMDPLVSRIRAELASHIDVLQMLPPRSSRQPHVLDDESIDQEDGDEEGDSHDSGRQLNRWQLERMLASIQGELTSKAELLSAYEQQRSENLLMKTKYEEQLAFLQESVNQLKKDKMNDSSAKRETVPQLAKISRDKYEAKIQKLTKELTTLKEKYQEAMQSKVAKGSVANAEPMIDGLKTTIASLKGEKNRLITTMTEEMGKLRTLLEMRDAEIKELKLLEKSAVEEAKMHKKNLDYQKSMMKKKSTTLAVKRVGFKSPPRAGPTLATAARKTTTRHLTTAAAPASLSSSQTMLGSSSSSPNVRAISEGLQDGSLSLSGSPTASTDRLHQHRLSRSELVSMQDASASSWTEESNACHRDSHSEGDEESRHDASEDHGSALASLNAKSQLLTTHFPRPQVLGTPSIGSTPASPSRAVRKNAWILTRNDMLTGSSPIVGLVTTRSGPLSSCTTLFSKEDHAQGPEEDSDISVIVNEDDPIPGKSLLGR